MLVVGDLMAKEAGRSGLITRIALCSLVLTLTTSYADTLCPLPHTISDKTHNLSSLVDIALTCNPNTQLAWANVKYSMSAVGVSQGNYWPRLNGALSATANRNTTSNNNSSSSTRNTTRHNYAPSINLSYVLWDFGTRFHQLEAAKLQQKAQLFLQTQASQQIILQVAQAYYQVLGQKALLSAAKYAEKQARLNLNAANSLHKQGLATIGDIYQAQSSLANAQLTQQQTEGALAIARGQLATALGLSPSVVLKLANLPQQVSTKGFLQRVDYFLAVAKENRPDLQAAEIQTAVAQHNLLALQSAVLPSLRLSTENSWTHPTNAASGGRISSLTATVNIPLFAGFADYHLQQQAEASIEQAQAQQNILANEVNLQVWQAYYSAKTAAKALNSTSLLVKSSQQAARQAQGQYKAGVGNILTVLSTETTEANALAQGIQAKLNWYSAQIQLLVALGDLPLGKLPQ
jgi:outer membrane protein